MYQRRAGRLLLSMAELYLFNPQRADSSHGCVMTTTTTTYDITRTEDGDDNQWIRQRIQQPAPTNGQVGGRLFPQDWSVTNHGPAQQQQQQHYCHKLAIELL